MENPNVTFTDEAKVKVLEYMKSTPENSQILRVAITGRTAKFFTYAFGLDEIKNQAADDVVIEASGIKVLFDAKTAKSMNGAKVDWVENVNGAGFNVENPNLPELFQNPRALKVQELLDNEINPGVANHGGFVELMDVKDDKVFLKFGGGCHGCGMANATLKEGIEVRIKEAIPEVTEVVDVTDHATGADPYYAP